MADPDISSIRIEVPCPKCRGKSLQGLAELEANDSVACINQYINKCTFMQRI